MGTHPSREVDKTLLCGAANRDRVRVKSMFALVGGPLPLRTLDGLATCWAYHSQGGCSSKYDRKWDHCPSAAEDNCQNFANESDSRSP